MAKKLLHKRWPFKRGALYNDKARWWKRTISTVCLQKKFIFGDMVYEWSVSGQRQMKYLRVA